MNSMFVLVKSIFLDLLSNVSPYNKLKNFLLSSCYSKVTLFFDLAIE